MAGVGSDNAFKITSGGTITQIIDLSEDGLDNPRGIAGDASGNVYVPGFLSDNAYRIARSLGDLISFSNGAVGDSFHEPGNWAVGWVPDWDDTANFTLAVPDPGYTVTASADVFIDTLSVRTD
ncbi:MAG: hypothetical protein IID42_02775, partial [Planctomycetes bacterium]|nr:hypothetical protein [Planctomycetota bacterium]